VGETGDAHSGVLCNDDFIAGRYHTWLHHIGVDANVLIEFSNDVTEHLAVIVNASVHGTRDHHTSRAPNDKFNFGCANRCGAANPRQFWKWIVIAM